MQSLIQADGLPSDLLAALENRDISLWLVGSESIDVQTMAAVAKLPWREVFVSLSDDKLLKELSKESDDRLIRRRGFIQIVATDPSLVGLPPRALPIYILDGDDPSESQFDGSLRRMSMLGALRRSNIHRLLVLSDEDATPPPELQGLIDPQFNPYVTFISATERGRSQVGAWSDARSGGPPAQLVRSSPVEFARELTSRYDEVYPEDKTVVRMRTISGESMRVDLTGVDDPERPILAHFELIQERDLGSVPPAELSEDEFGDFFEGAEVSWRPFAAGVPWTRDREPRRMLERSLNRIDSLGAAENKIAYIAAEPGAGGTTLMRQLAWEAAQAGYPALVARPVPFQPDSLGIAGFLTRAHYAARSTLQDEQSIRSEDEEPDRPRLYETPWVIAFDRSHWELREGELRQFVAELQRSGRAALVLVVTGPVKPIEFYSETQATEVAVLTHIIDADDAVALGRHLNVYLREYGKQRSPEEWARFHQQHNVRYLGSSAAFWIALSFWLRSTRDLTGTVQDWIYRAFVEHASSSSLKQALIEIAALSTERLALNEGLLPPSDDQWPLALRLEDKRRSLTALGLVRVSADGETYWALAHDILGRLLINAVFHDHAVRVELGYVDARDAEHLRFLALKRVAVKRELAELRYRPLADEFATTIFKVDPDHGAGAFAPIWREVLAALNEMPKLLRDTSRLFRHHTAISRRRIAKLEGPIYNVSVQDQVSLLKQAVEDIEYAIQSIDRSPGDEPNINLYNSLANAYLDLADAKAASGASREEVFQLRTLANEATGRAYAENPTNPFVVETHIKNLLSVAKAEPDQAVTVCLEALQAVYEALRAEDSLLRTPQLSRLAETALDILFRNSAPDARIEEPQTEIDVLVNAWRILSSSVTFGVGELLEDLPPDVADAALAMLDHPAGKGDIQVLRLSYGLLSSVHPFAFRRRLESLENLQASDTRLSPQLQLEYALLLFQVGRAAEGDMRFQELRRLWRQSEHFVRVPAPLDWLREGESEALMTVQAVVGSEQGFRTMAKVADFGHRTALFRAEEFGVRAMRPGTRFRAHVSFGHNGPFLRPPTARPRRT